MKTNRAKVITIDHRHPEPDWAESAEWHYIDPAGGES